MFKLTDHQRKVVTGLSDTQKYFLAACYSDGFSYSEVARWFGISVETVKEQIRRASDRLAANGLPRPEPYGRGSREELRAALPCLMAVV